MKQFNTIFFLIILSLIPIRAWSNSGAFMEKVKPDNRQIEHVRNEFYLAVKDEDAANRLTGFIRSEFGTEQMSYTPRILAYLGAAEALKASYAFNPYNKFRHVINGLKKLNSAVERAPEELEVRFLRFAVLHNIPALFGVGDERQSDLLSILISLKKKDYSRVDGKLQKGIIEFMLESGRLDENQQTELQGLLAEIG